MFQECFKKFQGYFTKVSSVFWWRLKGISREFSAGFMGIWKSSKGKFREVSKVFKNVLKKFQGHSKKVFMVLQGSFKGVSMEYYADFKGSKGVQGHWWMFLGC